MPDISQQTDIVIQGEIELNPDGAIIVSEETKRELRRAYIRKTHRSVWVKIKTIGSPEEIELKPTLWSVYNNELRAQGVVFSRVVQVDCGEFTPEDYKD